MALNFLFLKDEDGCPLGKRVVLSWVELLKDVIGENPDKICKHLGIEIIYLEDGRTNWDCRLFGNGLVWAIAVNKKASKVRQDFGKAHEIIHYLILKNTISSPASEEIEDLCDYGAHQLILKREG